MRIQILPLPAVMVGDDLQEPFAVIVDQFEWPIDESASAKWRQFKEQCGARAVVVDPGTVEIVDRNAEPAAEPKPQQPQVSVSAPDLVDVDAKEIARDLARAMGMPVQVERDPLLVGYGVIRNGSSPTFLGHRLDEVADDREAADRLRVAMAEKYGSYGEDFIVVKLVRLDDEQEQC